MVRSFFQLPFLEWLKRFAGEKVCGMIDVPVTTRPEAYDFLEFGGGQSSRAFRFKYYLVITFRRRGRGNARVCRQARVADVIGQPENNRRSRGLRRNQLNVQRVEKRQLVF